MFDTVHNEPAQQAIVKEREKMSVKAATVITAAKSRPAGFLWPLMAPWRQSSPCLDSG